MRLDDSKTMTNENMLTRFLHNKKLKLFFSKTFIYRWATGYKWEKTPTTPNNLNVALNALNDLQVYYSQVSKDPKKLKRAQGLFGGFFSGFWTRVFQRMAGNTTKLDTIAKFNADMGRTVPRLYQQMVNLFKRVDSEAERLGITAAANQQAPATAEATLTEDGDDEEDATPPEDDAKKEQKAKEVEQEAMRLFKMLVNLNKRVDSVNKKQATPFHRQASAILKSETEFKEDVKAAVENNANFADELYRAITKLGEETDDDNKTAAFITAVVTAGPDNVQTFVDFILEYNPDTDKGSAQNGISAFYSILSTANDNNENQIKWENGGLDKLSNLYMAENSLYKVIVFLGAWVDNVNAGKVYDNNGDKHTMDTKEIMSFLKTPTGKAFTQFSTTLNDINNKFSQQSAFGTLQESTLNEISYELNQLTERYEAMKDKKLKRTNEALNRLKQCMEIAEPAPVEPEVPKDAQDCNKAPTLTLEFDFGEENQPQDALDRLKTLVYDGEPPEMEPPVDEKTEPPPVEDTKDEVIEVVTEAPGDPNDPNAQDPNAQDPNAPPAPAPGAAMNTADLGTPPVDPNDPTAGGTADPSAAPAPGGDAGAAPADPNAAPADPNQQNAAGEAPNADQSDAASGDKFDIGADKAYNDSSDELNLTDQEQEQLFTKINLLTKVPDLVNYGKYFYNITPENVDLDDIHYINALYELSVKLGLLTDDFEGNNLLEKYDSYKYSVLSKNPEKDLQDQAEQVAESSKKVKIEATGETVEVITAPGVVIAKDVDDYMKQKDEANAEMRGELKFKDALNRARGMGSLVTFTGILFGYPAIKTLFIKGPKDEDVAKEEAIKQIEGQGYQDVEILAIEPVDPIDYLYREYAGMRTLEDEFTREYMKQRLEKKVAKAVGRVTESVEVGNGIPEELDADVGGIVDNLNKEIMQDPTIDFSKDVGLPKMMLAKEDFEACVCKSPITEDDDDCKCRCDFKVKKTDKGNLAKVLFSSNCQKVCKCLEGIASTYGITLEAIAEGENILEGADTITLTFKK